MSGHCNALSLARDSVLPVAFAAKSGLSFLVCMSQCVYEPGALSFPNCLLRQLNLRLERHEVGLRRLSTVTAPSLKRMSVRTCVLGAKGFNPSWAVGFWEW